MRIPCMKLRWLMYTRTERCLERSTSTCTDRCIMSTRQQHHVMSFSCSSSTFVVLVSFHELALRRGITLVNACM